MVREVPGTRSVLGSSNRIALPDEVFLFNTANDKERALALYSLIMLSPSFSASEKAQLALDQGHDGWTVRFLDSEWSGRDL